MQSAAYIDCGLQVWQEASVSGVAKHRLRRQVWWFGPAMILLHGSFSNRHHSVRPLHKYEVRCVCRVHLRNMQSVLPTKQSDSGIFAFALFTWSKLRIADEANRAQLRSSHKHTVSSSEVAHCIGFSSFCKKTQGGIDRSYGWTVAWSVCFVLFKFLLIRNSLPHKSKVLIYSDWRWLQKVPIAIVPKTWNFLQ